MDDVNCYKDLITHDEDHYNYVDPATGILHHFVKEYI